MGLFKKKKTSALTPPKDVGGESSIPTTKKTKKKFGFLKSNKESKDSNKPVAKESLSPDRTIATQERDVHEDIIHDEEGAYEADLGDIPRSISTPTLLDEGELLPPATPGSTKRDEEDSLGSPCETALKHQQAMKNNCAADTQQADAVAAAERAETIANLTSIMANTTPSLDHMAHYIQALSTSTSPDPSGDLPSRALRCLFSLSEHASHKAQRIDMVKGVEQATENDATEEKKEENEETSNKNGTSTPSLIPTLLSFLKRCPRDSSEQYLTLLVLNNLSIPTQNKRPIALQHGGAKTLGRLLCEDPGCHLLVIIIVNLTFGNEVLNRDLLSMSGTSVREAGVGGGVDVDNDAHDGGGSKTFLSCGGDVQLVDSLGYALLLASLTTEQLEKLGPIPLTSPEGVPYNPRKLLSTLFSLLESKLGIHYRKCDGTAFTRVSQDARYNENDLPLLSLSGDNCPFPETARWCLGALKNLTRPGKLTPLSAVDDQQSGALVSDASSVASQAILDAGILPLLLRILKIKEGGGDSSGTLYNWSSNSAQDAALYTVVHMTSVPQLRQVLREEYKCVEVLAGILNYGKVVQCLFKNASSELVQDAGEEQKKEAAELNQASLQCLKARMAMSNLLLGSDIMTSTYSSAIILAEYEVDLLIELLAHASAGRAKEGAGGYSSATFNLKGVLFVIKCILSESKNRQVFVTSMSGRRLNALMFKVIARYTVLNDDSVTNILDAEAVEYAITSLFYMTLCSMDEDVIGFSNPLFGASKEEEEEEKGEEQQQKQKDTYFLPMTFGDYGKIESKNALVNVMTDYLNKKDSETSPTGRSAANQILFRLNILKLGGTVEELSYKGKPLPSKSDFDLDTKLLAVLKAMPADENQKTGKKPKEYIFSRPIARHVKDGESTECSKVVYHNALAAVEDLLLNHLHTELDSIDMANNITYYADGLDVYQGFIWKWEDGQGDLIERVYSAAETEDQLMVIEDPAKDTTDRSEPYSPPRKGFLGRLKLPMLNADDDGPVSIFGLRCHAPMCGKGF